MWQSFAVPWRTAAISARPWAEERLLWKQGCVCAVSKVGWSSVMAFIAQSLVSSIYSFVQNVYVKKALLSYCCNIVV